MSTGSTVVKPSLFQRIVTFSHDAGVKIENAFIAIFGKDAATKFAQASLSMLKTAEGKIVLDAVQVAEALPAGADKRSAAFSQITSDLKTQGKSLASSEINMLIELAVQYMQGTIAPANS